MAMELQLRNEMVRYGRLLHERGLTAARDGNLSCRLDARTMLITPSGLSKGMIEAEDLVIADMHGHKLAGRYEVSSEIEMHALIYRVRPDVGGITHAHPPTATGFAVAGIPMDEPFLAETTVTLGDIPIAPYATPGTRDLAESIEPFIVNHDAVLMANHGVVCCGVDLLQSYLNMELVEHAAKILLAARQLGGPRKIQGEDLQKLRELRERCRANAQPVPVER